MDSRSQETLRMVEENDDTLTHLQIGIDYNIGFSSTDGDDFSRLGAAIGDNTHLTTLVVILRDVGDLSVTNNEFYDGLKQNSSINKLTLMFWGMNIAGGVGQKILETYQENNSNLTDINISRMGFENGGEHILAETLRMCTNLQEVCLYNSNINDVQLSLFIEATRGHRSLEYLNLNGSRIGIAGCETFATLLRDPNCNLHTLNLSANSINIEGTTILANALLNNTKLRILNLHGNPINQSLVNHFNKLLCNISSINSIYSSNHILENLGPSQLLRLDLKLTSLLKMNKGKNKSHVAIKKILLYHPNIDMEPLFEWNMEGEGERDLKALPYVVAWFKRAGEAVADAYDGRSCNIEENKLSAMYQFAKAMPLLFVPVPHDNGGNNKRKRDN